MRACACGPTRQKTSVVSPTRINVTMTGCLAVVWTWNVSSWGSAMFFPAVTGNSFSQGDALGAAMVSLAEEIEVAVMERDGEGSPLLDGESDYRTVRLVAVAYFDGVAVALEFDTGCGF